MKRLIFLSVFAFICINLYSIPSAKVAVFSTNTGTQFNHSSTLKDLCALYFNKKYCFTAAEREYFNKKERYSDIQRAENSIKNAYLESNYVSLSKAIESADNLKNKNYNKYDFDTLEVTFNSYNLTLFKPLALFYGSPILAQKIIKDSSSDYILIPTQEDLNGNLMRLRLMMYSAPEEKFTTIYDDVVPSLDAKQMVEDNIVKLFEFFLGDDMGVISFPIKEYGYSVFIDGERSSDNISIKSGVHSIVITSEGYEDYRGKIEIKPLEVNKIEFDLKKHNYKDLLISADGFMYDGFSSMIGSFKLPHFFSDYSTPSSLSFSFPGFETKYMSLTKKTDRINISLKPEFLSSTRILNEKTKRFYSSIFLSLISFALDITSRSFINQYPNSKFWNISQKTFSGIGYFSIGLVFYTLIDYYYQSLYIFE